jgi:hypothetical protein
MAQTLTEINKNVFSVLERAGKLFAEHGGAVGRFSEDNKICALKALYSVTDTYGWQVARQVSTKSSIILDRVA